MTPTGQQATEPPASLRERVEAEVEYLRSRVREADDMRAGIIGPREHGSATANYHAGRFWAFQAAGDRLDSILAESDGAVDTKQVSKDHSGEQQGARAAEARFVFGGRPSDLCPHCGGAASFPAAACPSCGSTDPAEKGRSYITEDGVITPDGEEADHVVMAGLGYCCDPWHVIAPRHPLASNRSDPLPEPRSLRELADYLRELAAVSRKRGIHGRAEGYEHAAKIVVRDFLANPVEREEGKRGQVIVECCGQRYRARPDQQTIHCYRCGEDRSVAEGEPNGS